VAPITPGRPPRPRSGHGSAWTSAARFAVPGLVITVALAVVTGVLARLAGAAEASRSFENLVRVTAAALSPLLDVEPSASETKALLRSELAGLQGVGPVVRVTVRDASGRVLGSDDPHLVGQVFPLDAAKQRALRDGVLGSAVLPGTRPEDRSEHGTGKLLEAYVGVKDVQGTPLLVDVFGRDDDAAIAAWQSWLSFAPAALGALLLLQVVHVTLASRLARRLRESQEAEDGLLWAVVQASDAERRRIARELHDHVVQDLTGLAFELDHARLSHGSRGGQEDGEEEVRLIARTADDLRRSVGDLRTMLASQMPADVASDGLGPALENLARGLRRSGVGVRVRTSGLEDVPPAVAALLYRCAEEALRNVAAHSRARTVDVSVRGEENGVTMVVDDDGRGFDEGRLQERGAAGHLGLRALGDLLRDAGGSLTASSAPGQGTRLLLTVPRARPHAGTRTLR
jgi:two-component system, NarL family, sensor kinase